MNKPDVLITFLYVCLISPCILPRCPPSWLFQLSLEMGHRISFNRSYRRYSSVTTYVAASHLLFEATQSDNACYRKDDTISTTKTITTINTNQSSQHYLYRQQFFLLFANINRQIIETWLVFVIALYHFNHSLP